MTKQKVYRYLGRNGMITTPVLLEGANPIIMYRLTADTNKRLTNGTITVLSVDVFADDVDNWYEVPYVKE